MAAVAIALPGSLSGPCESACAHTDCARSRDDAETLCGWCNHEIGYGRPWLEVPDASGEATPMHEDCADCFVDARRPG